jgi:predicted acetyltransferase
MIAQLAMEDTRMADGIRNLRIDEFDPFVRFLNRSFGFGRGVFEASFPHIYHPTPELCAATFVMEQDGQIVSHVGVYPLEVEIHATRWSIAGIGGVGTLPAARGKGYMTQLLYHVLDAMRERGYVLSWLGGDRQRYNTFGWESAGSNYELTFSRRALDRAGLGQDAPVEILASDPAEALPVVERLQRTLACRAIRADLAAQLRKSDLSIWTTADGSGYALLRGRPWGPMHVMELASSKGQEASILRAIMDWTRRDELTWILPACDEARLARLMPYTRHWRRAGWDMWRIVDLAQALALACAIMQQRAAAVRDFKLAIGMVEHDRTQAATLSVRDGEVQVTPGRHADAYVEWPVVDATRLLIGGPTVARPPALPDPLWAGLRALLPIPAFLPPLDHV